MSRTVPLPTLKALSDDLVRVSETLEIARAELRATRRHACELSKQRLQDSRRIEQLQTRLDWMEKRMGRNSLPE
ncbi:MAG: hypothetical protein AAF613_01415 [Pseudomonadota bacterium]